MRRWLFSSNLQGRSLPILRSWPRSFTTTPRLATPYTEHVHVPCASAGHINVSLHNVKNHPVSAPLIINFPAFPNQDIANVDSYLPSFLHQFPSATIHYRWSKDRDPGPISNQDSPSYPANGRFSGPIPTPLHWPTPVTDTLAAYDFLIRTLSPSPNGGGKFQRRDVYVHGSYLGASLAASLALTESHAHKPMAVRGLLAFNGIYNWTTFLPDHPINRIMLHENVLGLGIEKTYEDVGLLRARMPELFANPANLFDPFASPVLFFHTSGMMVPPSFTERWTPDLFFKTLFADIDKLSSSSSSGGGGGGAAAAAIAAAGINPYDYVYSDPEDPPPPTPYPEDESEDESDPITSTDDNDIQSTGETLNTSTIPIPTPKPRKGYLTFPPLSSTLKIPETLLLHSTAPPLPKIPSSVVGQRRRVALWKKLKNADNSFESQAAGLAGLMRRSVNKFELKERMRWDDDFENWDGEAVRRISLEDTGEFEAGSDDEFRMSDRVDDMAMQWLDQRM